MIEINQEHFLDAISVHRITGKRNGAEGRASLLCGNGKLFVQCANDEFTMTSWVPCDGEFKASIDARCLAAFIRSAKDSIKIIPEENSVIFRSGRSTSKLPSMNDGIEIHKGEIDERTMIEVDCAEFGSIAKSIIHSIGREDFRHVLGGMYMHLDQGVLRICASNGVKASVAMMNVRCKKELKSSAIMPAKSVAEVIKLSASSIMTIGMLPSSIVIYKENKLIDSRTLGTKFPSLKNLFSPKEFFIEASRHELLESIDRVGVTSEIEGERFRSKRIQLQAEKSDNRLIVSSKSGAGEEMIDEIIIESTNHSFNRYMNPSHLQPIIKLMKGETVKFAYNSKLETPIEITDGSSTLHVMMPIRV